MAIRHEIFKASAFNMHDHKCEAGKHECKDGCNEEPWRYDGKCYGCAQDEQAVVVDGVTYINPWIGRSKVETHRTAYGDKVFAITHEGLVIASRERNYYDDSDFYALVWNPETFAVEEVSVGTTRMGGTDDNHASVDLADEHKPAYREYLIAQQERDLEASEVSAWREAMQAAITPHKGSRVKVVKGKKVPVGFAGVVFWIGEQRTYSRWETPGLRLGVRSDSGDTEFVAAANCVVEVDEDDLPLMAEFTRTPAERRQIAEGLVDRGYGFGSLVKSFAPAGVVVA